MAKKNFFTCIMPVLMVGMMLAGCAQMPPAQNMVTGVYHPETQARLRVFCADSFVELFPDAKLAQEGYAACQEKSAWAPYVQHWRHIGMPVADKTDNGAYNEFVIRADQPIRIEGYTIEQDAYSLSPTAFLGSPKWVMSFQPMPGHDYEVYMSSMYARRAGMYLREIVPVQDGFTARVVSFSTGTVKH